MRIISGKFKGRKFYPPAKDWPTRPTTDYAKEGLFNVLNNRVDFEALKVLDLFCGTGNHTYEFLSRGCTDLTCVDKHPPAIRFVKQTLKTLECEEFVKVVRADVFKFMGSTRMKYDYIFAGPPYGLPTINKIPDLIFEHDLLADDGLFVMEHNPNHSYQNHPKFQNDRNYGKTIFSFFGFPSDDE
ncbi:MAG: RsmD family RNA methyltransferase [Bacteroidota bacterium]